jgi:UDP-glucose 4-epimerase
MNLKDARILLVGGAGLVGSHLVDQLVNEPVAEIVVFDNFLRGRRANLAAASASPKVRIVEGSMMDTAALAREMRGIDGVFLLASLWLGECVSDPRLAWEVNTLGTWNVVEACRAAGVKRVVYSSSASVYGNAVVTPMTEDHPFNKRTTYVATKIANEQMERAIGSSRANGRSSSATAASSMTSFMSKMRPAPTCSACAPNAPTSSSTLAWVWVPPLMSSSSYCSS